MPGSDRANSKDLRVIGAVPRHLQTGRAERVIVSADITGNGLPRLGRTVGRLQ